MVGYIHVCGSWRYVAQDIFNLVTSDKRCMFQSVSEYHEVDIIVADLPFLSA